jgi:hypothetical protein
MPTITILEQDLCGKPSGELTFELLTETVTVRELIRSRVYERVQDHARGTASADGGRLPAIGNVPFVKPAESMVESTEAERALNGTQTARAERQVDWRPEFEQACKAFETNQLLVLVDSRQVSELDEVVTVRHDSRVAFMKLVPLVGG